MKRSPTFYQADLQRLQDTIEQAIWDWMIDHGTYRKPIVRAVDDAIQNVEHQLEVATTRTP